MRREGVLAIVTRSEKGSIVIDGRADARGARLSDRARRRHDRRRRLFAAGFLAGLAQRRRRSTACARLGALAAAEIIQHLGARPLVSLAGLARQTAASA